MQTHGARTPRACTHTQTHTHTYIHTHAHTYRHTHTGTQTHTHTGTHTHTWHTAMRVIQASAKKEGDGDSMRESTSSD